MGFDPAIASSMLRNRSLRAAHGWSEVYDLNGALATTSDAPIPGLNCLLDFVARDHDIEALLDIGFALLRAFDRAPLVELTPLDRPKSLPKRLAARGFVRSSQGSWMRYEGDSQGIRINPDVEVRIAEPDDARAFAQVVGGSTAWLRKIALQTTLNAMLEPGNTFYLGCIDGEPVSTLHLVIDGYHDGGPVFETAGIYAVGTRRAYRGKGISSTLMARAIADAQAAGCDVIGLSTVAGSDAERLYTKQGFVRVFTSEMWALPEGS